MTSMAEQDTGTVDYEGRHRKPDTPVQHVERFSARVLELAGRRPRPVTA